MTKSRGIHAPRKPWTEADLCVLRDRYPHERTDRIAVDLGRSVGRVYQKAIGMGLRKSAAYLASPDACRLRRGGNVGEQTRFPAGHQPANKGVRRPKGWAPGRMAETQFRKGERHGVATNLYRAIGAERISKDGYLERKINDGMPLQARWRAVHLLVWEAVNGPIPEGHCLCFRDRDKQHIALENLELITRAERMRRNTIHRYPDELKSTIRLAGKLKRAIGDRHEKQD